MYFAFVYQYEKKKSNALQGLIVSPHAQKYVLACYGVQILVLEYTSTGYIV